MNKAIFFFAALLIFVATSLPGAPEASEFLIFYQSFNSGSKADLSCGSANAAEVIGTVKFVKGLEGQALWCGEGGGSIRYHLQENLNFDKPGTVVFWFKPAGNWHENPRTHTRVFFWGIESNDAFFGLQIDNAEMLNCPCARQIHTLILYTPRGNKVYALLPQRSKIICTESWHLISVAWAGYQLLMSFDGNPYKAFKLDMPLSNAELFKYPFRIGSESQWNYALDDFCVYSRKLTDAEIQQIFQKGIKTIEKDDHK